MNHQIKAVESCNKLDLETGFNTFSKLADDLANAYYQLQTQVSELNKKLESVSREKLLEITEKQRLESQQKELLSILPTAVIVLDAAGVVIDCNPAAKNLLNHPLLAENWRDVISTIFCPRDDDGHEISLRDGKRVSIVTRSIEDGPGQIIVIHDLTETRALQEQLSRDQRLKSVGKTAASLAHQIRTPLASALLYASHLCDENLSDEKKQSFAFKLKNRLMHLEQQVKDMLLCVKGGQLILEKTDINKIIQNIQAICEEKLKSNNANLIITKTCQEKYINGNQDALIGVIQNIINNALEAGAKKIEFEIAKYNHQKYIYFKLTDNGQGMCADTLNKVGELFFTTRAQGTGLGLDIVKAIVKAHKGRFEIHSKENEGTIVLIKLPQWIKDRTS